MTLKPKDFVSPFTHMEKTEYMLSKSGIYALQALHKGALLTYGKGQSFIVQATLCIEG